MYSIQQKQLCQQYLEMIYCNIRRSEFNSENKNSIPESYGEILYKGLNKLISKVSISEQDIFFDLGSGMGKAVLQFFLLSRVKECHGIEIIPELHQIAVNAADRIHSDLSGFYAGDRRLVFMQGSFFDISFERATILLIGSPCFTPTMMAVLGRMIEETPGIHTVYTFKPITTLKRLRFLTAFRVDCSWDSALCYIYGKD